MNTPIYLKPWLSNWVWGTRIALFLILLSAIVQFVTFALSQNYVVSYLGAQPEDITFSIQICYVGIISALPIQFRFLRHFQTHYYLLVVIFFGILLAIACRNTTDIIQFFIIRYFQGVIVCCISGSMLTVIPTFLKPEHRLVLGSYIFYGTVLSSGVLIGVVASEISLNANFTNVYYYLVMFQVATLIIVLLGFNTRSIIKPYPLWQIDWIGAIFLITAASGLVYTLVYGSKFYWFDDKRIITSTLLTTTATIFYLYRELTVKRPLINLVIFKYRKFWIGIILLVLYYGIKESINIVFGYTSLILQWSAPELMKLGLYNDAGLVLFMIISASLMLRIKNLFTTFLITGFSMLIIYHLWIYFIFTPDLAFTDLVPPVFFQGAASGLLFGPIMVFIISSVPPTMGYTPLVIAAYTRFTSLLNAGAGFYNLQLYYNQLYREGFLMHLTYVDDQTVSRLDSFKQLFQSKGYTPDQAMALANVSVSKALAIQSQLLSTRATFLLMALISSIILVVISLVLIFKKWISNNEQV